VRILKYCNTEKVKFRLKQLYAVLNKSKRIISISFFSVLIFLLSFKDSAVPITVGLDPSWVFALNYFFANNIPFGKDIIFTYGPLGCLFFAQPIKNNLLMGFIAVSILKFSFIASLLYLDSILKRHHTFADRLLNLVIIFLMASIIALDLLFPFMTVTFLLLYRETKKGPIFLIFAVLISAIGFLVKSSSGILCLLISLSYNTIDFFQTRNIKRLIFYNLGLILSFLSMWIILYHNLSGIFDYLHGIVELSIGNSSAMTINPIQNWLLFLIFLLLHFYLPVYIREEKANFLYGILFLPSYAYYKYAVSRIDHLYLFLIFITTFYLLLLIYIKEIKPKVLAIIVISVLCFSWNIKFMFTNFNLSNWVREIEGNIINGSRNFVSIAVNFKDYENKLMRQSLDNLQANKLEKEVINTIGKGSVDTYPWETTYIAANNLNWRPRPVFQSYAAYTPWLDRKNAEFLNSGKAPRFIIWQLNHPAGEVGSIDGRYLLNDEPLTIFQILNHYDVIHKNNKIALLERSLPDNLKEPKTIYTTDAKWNDWINVPFDGNGIVRANIRVKRKPLGSLKKLAYKEEETFITYRCQDLETRKFRLVLDNAISGVWINPLILKISKPLYGIKVKEILLTHSRYDFFDDWLEINWQIVEPRNPLIEIHTFHLEKESNLQKMQFPAETNNLVGGIDILRENERVVSISGWAAISGQSSENSEIYIIFRSSKNAYIFDTFKVKRQDVTAYFKTVNYDDSGFDALVGKNTLEPAKYRLGIYVRKGKIEGFQYTDKIVAIEKTAWKDFGDKAANR